MPEEFEVRVEDPRNKQSELKYPMNDPMCSLSVLNGALIDSMRSSA